MRRIIFTTLGTVAVCAALVAAGQAPAPARQATSPPAKKAPATAKPATQKATTQKPAPIMAVAHEGALLTSAEQTAMVK